MFNIVVCVCISDGKVWSLVAKDDDLFVSIFWKRRMYVASLYLIIISRLHRTTFHRQNSAHKHSKIFPNVSITVCKSLAFNNRMCGSVFCVFGNGVRVQYFCKIYLCAQQYARHCHMVLLSITYLSYLIVNLLT